MSSLVQSARSSACFQSLMGFFFNKGVRGGPRILLNLAAVIFGLFVFVKLLPQRVTQNALNSIPISWSPLSDYNEANDASDGSVSGGLRIVVFGELDVGTPVGVDLESENAQSWTQALCEKQLFFPFPPNNK
ncbi:hypothetical protein BD289DRAFT_486676 [Coniella lustricola]|uniref:Uncharacterized protein n=1 Tax=Coniella lustricola TaxID=2025994 RepID=A0A2T2ZU98_9PEZI|nr:hypothetical protein BD289DRAFT_486676 [Coniella lustricola]